MNIVVAWQGYLPVSTDRRELTLQRKRQEYQNLLAQVWPSHYDENNQETFRQVRAQCSGRYLLAFFFFDSQRIVSTVKRRSVYCHTVFYIHLIILLELHEM